LNTLAIYQTLTNDEVLAGVIDTTLKYSPLLNRLPLKEFQGKNFTFNIENAMAGVGWYVTNDTITESAGTWAQGTVGLATMGGDVDTDLFAAKTMGNINDIMSINIAAKAKAMAYEFERAFLYGGTTTTPDAKEMKGILKWIANYETTALTVTDLDGLTNPQVVPGHGTHAVLSLPMLDQLIDTVKPKPDILLFNRRMRRYLNTLMNTTASSAVRVVKDEFGAFVTLYNEIPVVINDFSLDTILDNSSSVLAIASINQAATYSSSSADNSVILALRFDPKDGVCGIQNGAMQHYPIGELETKRAFRNRFMWDLAVVMLGRNCAAALTGVSDES
jgi:hypothetical protein